MERADEISYLLSLEIVGWNANMQIKGKNFVMGIFGNTASLRPF